MQAPIRYFIIAPVTLAVSLQVLADALLMECLIFDVAKLKHNIFYSYRYP